MLFDVGNINDLVKAIILLLNDAKLCKQLGDSGFEHVNKKFTKTILKKAFVEYINLKLNLI